MEKQEAIELVERWLRAQGFEINAPGGRKVDAGAVRLRADGWYVPFNTTEGVDTGDPVEFIVPFPACVVTEPDGELRIANTTQHPGFSVPATWPGEPRVVEQIDPEYERAGLYGFGVPNRRVAGWTIIHPDGREESKINRNYRPGPLRLGLPWCENNFELVLNYFELNELPRRALGTALMVNDILIPGTEEGLPTNVGMLRVGTSPRKLGKWTSWWRMTGATFAARYPRCGLVINAGNYPSVVIQPEEVAEAFERMSAPVTELHMTREGIKPGEPVFEEEYGVYGSENAKAREIAERFGLDQELYLPPHYFPAARESGYDLSREERDRMLLGLAWTVTNPPRESWPADLHANGLVKRHDDAGNEILALDTRGKFTRERGHEPNRSWHAVQGAYLGFAIGEALGSAVDGLTWPQIQERYGPHGIADLDTVFERPGQVGWLTQLMLFQTESYLRVGHARGHRRTLTSSATARWLHTQGLPWDQAAGPLLADHPEPGGWLVHVPELRARRGVTDELIENARAALAEPNGSALAGPLRMALKLPEAATGLQQADLRNDKPEVAAQQTFHHLLRRMFRPQTWTRPLWMQFDEVPEEYLGDDSPITPLFKDLHDRWRSYLRYDVDLIEGIGDGMDAQSVLGRAVFAASRRGEYAPKMALRVAVNHSGRSALTGAVAGALIGARLGVGGLPQDWVEALDVRDLLHELAEDVYWGFTMRNSLTGKSDWEKRYPRLPR